MRIIAMFGSNCVSEQLFSFINATKTSERTRLHNWSAVVISDQSRNCSDISTKHTKACQQEKVSIIMTNIVKISKSNQVGHRTAEISCHFCVQICTFAIKVQSFALSNYMCFVYTQVYSVTLLHSTPQAYFMRSFTSSLFRSEVGCGQVWPCQQCT